MKRVVVFLGLAIVLCVAAALTYAPYLPQIVREGYPGLIWSGAGQYQRVVGSEAIKPLAGIARIAEPGEALATLFAQSEGRALLAARGDTLEIELYAPGVTSQTPLNSFSMAKGLVGALVFKALAEGRIDSLDQTLAEFLPQYGGIADVTIRALLTMTSGIHFHEGGVFGDSMGKDSETAPNPFGQLARLHFGGLDAVAPALTAEPQPVSTYTYRNLNTALLGRVLEEVYGQGLTDILAAKLWQPAGAGDARWRQAGAELGVSAYCCIYATARDWLRIGIYLLHNGTPDQPFLPERLWRDYLGLDVPAAMRQTSHYGMHVWQNILDRPGAGLAGPFTYLMGQGGQVLYLLPEHDLVVYRAGEREQLLHSTLYETWDLISASY
jgi:CubicO group peptidase (beta-lactamase class C family)